MQSPGVGKGRAWRLCCAPQMEVQMLPRACVEGAQLGEGTPAPTPASDQAPVSVCCIRSSALAAVGKAFGCFVLCVRGTIQQVPVRGLD